MTALGANITIGSREDKIYRITPRENNDVNGVLAARFAPAQFQIRQRRASLDAARRCKGEPVEWRRPSPSRRRAPGRRRRAWLIASARQTNEELFLAGGSSTRSASTQHDVVPRNGEADGMMIVADRNPNTTGAKLLGLHRRATRRPAGGNSSRACAAATIKVVLMLGEDASPRPA